MQIKNIPSFFIVGAAKAGTTSLYMYLAQHPQVYMSPVKEPNHFSTDIDLDALREQVKMDLKAQDLDKFIASGMNGTLHRDYITDRPKYLSLFAPATGDKICGEASASYLYSKNAAKEIYSFNPAAKIIIILRNPVQRAYSHYLMDLKTGNTEKDFQSALEEDRAQKIKGWGASSLYLEAGMYFEQVKRYTDIFPSSQILILLNEDLKNRKEETLHKIFSFLDISENFSSGNTSEHNSAAVPRNKLVQKILRNHALKITLRKFLKNSVIKKIIANLLYSPPIKNKADTETILKLKEYFRDDINKLSKLINRDLKEWK